jgi:Domain of unknown function (DUF4263)
VNLLLTCSTTPEFSREALDFWDKFCIADWMPGNEIVLYLLFAPSAEFASIDAIVFLEPNLSVGFAERPDGYVVPFSAMTTWEAHWHNSIIAEKIRDLPETCAMRDGRKWKKIPQIVLTRSGHRHEAYDGLDVEFVIDRTEQMLLHGYSSPFTWIKIEQIVNQYHQRAMAEYERVGFLVTVDRGLYRVRRAFRTKNSNESEFYYGGKDRRRFHSFVTIGRDREGADYEAWLFEQLLNDPKAGEREFHRFFEEHPDLLAEAMMGVPISHRPYFASNKQTPDFAVSPVLPPDSGECVKLLELKGPEASLLASKRYLHRGLAPALTQALAQVSDYEESLRDPLNLREIEKALGYIPELAQKAVLIGRTPPSRDADLWRKRKAEQPSVRIITYDEVLQEQRERPARHRSRWWTVVAKSP